MKEFEPELGHERYDDMWPLLAESSQAQAADAWLRRLHGQRVVDLGSGTDTRHFERFLDRYGIESYRAVDLKNNPAQDMLETLLELAQGASYSLSLNGINERLISARSEYGKDLEEQIIGLLHPDGLVFGFSGGGVLKSLRDRTEMDSLFLPMEEVLSDPDNGFYFIAKHA